LSTFAKALSQNQNCLDQLNVFFQEGERLVLQNQNIDVENIEPPVSLSEQQLEVITQRMQFFKTTKGKKVLIRRQVAKLSPNFIKKATQ
jgi:DNA-directed RNA polymerase